MFRTAIPRSLFATLMAHSSGVCPALIFADGKVHVSLFLSSTRADQTRGAQLTDHDLVLELVVVALRPRLVHVDQDDSVLLARCWPLRHLLRAAEGLLELFIHLRERELSRVE